jgi:hypothetical protein
MNNSNITGNFQWKMGSDEVCRISRQNGKVANQKQRKREKKKKITDC